MKITKRTALMLALVLALALSLTACTSGCTETGSSSSSMSSSSSSSMSPSSSSSSSMTEPVPPETTPSSTTSSSSSAAETMSTDFAEIGALDGTRYDWGPGGPVDDKNRSQGALAYNKQFGAYNAVFVDEESKGVYLTFDMGYENGFTPQILDTLKEKNVKGVFFLTGHYAKSAPELVQRMIDEGHVLGNHSWGHPEDITSLPLSEVDASIMDLHTYIAENFGGYEMKLWRFPAGTFSEQTLRVAQSEGYRSVFWSFAYKDWLVDAQPDPAAATETMLKKAHPGAIYLIHAVSKTNADILGDVIDQLQAKGYAIEDPNGLIK